MTYFRNSRTAAPYARAAGIMALLISVCSFIQIVFSAKGTVCLADCLVMTSDGSFLFWIVIIPMCVIVREILVGFNLKTTVVLRSGSRRNIYRKQIGLMLFITAFVSIYATLFSLLTGSFFSTSLYNWHQGISIYFKVNYALNTTMSFAGVAVTCFINMFITIFLVLIVSFVIKEKFASQMFGIIYVVITMGWNVLQSARFPLATSFLSTNFYAYSHSSRFVYGYFICGTVIVIAGVCGLIIFEKRDFLYD